MNPLYIFKPEAKYSELTTEPSMWHVGIKGEFHIYLEIYHRDYETDEAIVVIYKNGEEVLAYGGVFKDTMRKIKTVIN